MAKDERLRLESELEAVQNTLRDALGFLGDDRNLTNEGIAARAALLREIEEIEKDVEAARQEHRAGY